MCGVPHSRFATLISRRVGKPHQVSLVGRRAVLISSAPGTEAGAMPSDDGLRLEYFHRVQRLRSQAIEPRNHQAIDVSDGDPLGRSTPQHGADAEAREFRFATLRATATARSLRARST